jgi:hypothetical protein
MFFQPKIELLDDRGGEIAACFFKEAAEKFYPLLEVRSSKDFECSQKRTLSKLILFFLLICVLFVCFYI